MMYSDVDMLVAIESQAITIEPFNLHQLGVNSYDVRLGNTFFEVIYESDGPYYIGPFVYLDGEKASIPVSGTLLGVTKEKVGTFGNVVAEVRSRSTTRRKGITTNCDAGLGDIGYCNYWTLELTAFVNQGQPFLTVGERIAQMVFYETKSAPTREYSGQYAAEWPYNMIPYQYRDRIINP